MPSVIFRSVGELALPVSCGLLLSSCFPPFNWMLAGWIALVPLAAAIDRPQARFETFLGVYLGGLLFHLAALDFIRTADGGAGLSGPHALTWLVLGQLGALGCLGVIAVARLLIHGAGWSLIAVLPVTWIAAELFREQAGQVISQLPFPWLKLGYTQAEALTLVQTADLMGVAGVCAVIVVVNALLYRTLRDLGRRSSAFSALATAAILASCFVYGRWRLEAGTSRGPVVALTPKHSLAADKQTEKSLAVDLNLWSETAISQQLDHTVAQECDLSLKLARAAADQGAMIVAGCRRLALNTKLPVVYNSAAFFDPLSGYQGAYDKRYLVPWAEFAPWGLYLTPASTKGIARGRECPRFNVRSRQTGETYSCGVAICYDVCFAEHFQRYALESAGTAPDLFVVPSCESSDATLRAPRMLLDMTRFRAIEMRRAIVRNVEGGYSGIIDSCGRLVSAPQEIDFKEPVVLGAVPIDNRMSFYCRSGEWLPPGCAGATLLGVMSPIFRRKRGPRTDSRPAP